MSTPDEVIFPWNLEEAASAGFGAAAWTKSDGSSVWIERNEAGFEAAAFWGGEMALGAIWEWTGEPGQSPCSLREATGAQAAAMAAAGLGLAAQHKRVLEIMGAMSMGPGQFASASWDDWAPIMAAGWGFSRSSSIDAQSVLAGVLASPSRGPNPLRGLRHGP